MNKFKIKKALCITLILIFSTQTTFAVQNYTIVKTTNENYSASSPVGKFSNYSNNGSGVQIPPFVVTTGTTYDNYNYYQPIATNTIAYQPAMPPIVNQYQTSAPVYPAGIFYDNSGNYNQMYNSQEIQVPQDYNKTTTMTEQCIDTRENADKVIDRSIKVVGTIAVVGAVAGLIFGILRK